MTPAMIEARVHHCVIDAFLTRGHPPLIDDIAATLAPAEGEPSRDAIGQALDRLATGHGLVLHPSSHRIWIAHPFSASPTATWVDAGDRGWWAPCLWCAFGIATLADIEVVIHALLAGERDRVAIRVPRGGPPTDELVVHFAMPPRDAWANVIHFCASVLPFRAESEIDAWSQRHGLPRGEGVPLRQVHELARRWYGNHRARDWVKWTIPEARQIFADAGFRGPFWEIPSGDRF